MTAKALFDAGFPTALSDSQATALGLKVYSHGGSYNGGNAPTVTLTSGGGTIGTIVVADFIPYQTQDGNWRLKFNMDIQMSSATRTQPVVNVAGITGVSQQSIAVGVDSGGAQLTTFGGQLSGAGFYQFYSSQTTIGHYYSGDVKLTGKPNFAY